MSNYSWGILYEDGSSASGDVYKDVVSVAGISTNHQAVQTAQKISPIFVLDTNRDGLMGLAFSNINTGTHMHVPSRGNRHAKEN
jgi:aspergillopepsin I